MTICYESGKIMNCHTYKEVFNMMNNEQEFYDTCCDDPTMIFTLIKKGYLEVVEKLIENNKVNINLCDTVGNDVMMRLLKAKEYDLVLKFMKKRSWNVNHQNVDGDTFGHILALDNSVSALNIVEQLKKKKNYIPNIINNKNETALDKSINNNYLLTSFKILEDKRFNNIDMKSFKKLLDSCLSNNYYGKYSKLNNLEVIVNNLEKKELETDLKRVVEEISDNMDIIKTQILKNKPVAFENIVGSVI